MTVERLPDSRFAVPGSTWAMHLRAPIAPAVADMAFGEAEVMLTPLLRSPVPTLVETDARDAPSLSAVPGRINHCTRPVNCLGFPALSLPALLAASGRPSASGW